jgi:hypothetical protein
MMAKTGISIVAIKQNKKNVLITLHAKKLNQDSAFSNDYSPKMKGVHYFLLTQSWWTKNLFLGYSRKHSTYDDGEILEVLLVALTLKR